MSTGDDPPKKPPRASWEPPDPDEAAPDSEAPPAKSKPASAPWTPPPLEEVPRKKTARSQTPPPRASWETPNPDEPAPAPRASASGAPAGPMTESSSVSGSWTAEPSVVVDAGSPAPAAPSAQTGVSGAYSYGSYEAQQSGSFAPESGAPAQPDASTQPSGSDPQPGDGGASSQPTASGSYASPGQPDPASAEPFTGVSGSTATPATVRSSDSDDPLAPLPTIAADNNLRSAVGAKLVKEPRKKPPPSFDDDNDDKDDDDDDDDKPKGRGAKLAIVASLAGVVALGIGALVIFGNINKQRFTIACEAQEVHAKQGRGFPPWGERTIDDEGMWKPIKIPPEAECRERETEDEAELSHWYLDILVERASSLLTAREVTKIDEASAILDQALLHARSPDRREQRRDIERLQGDVGYWRASAKLKDAATALTDAAKQFDAAAAQRPRHVSDASAWATYVRKLVEELRSGPNGTPTAAFPPVPPVTPGREPAPPGVALPVEPAAGSGSAEPPPSPPDAGMPTGGVLL